MDYERINKVQIGVISPSKLRMKLLGAQHTKKKEGASSSATSPSKLEEAENDKRNLLTGDLDDEVSSKDSTIASTNFKPNKTELSTKELSSSANGNPLCKGFSDTKHSRNNNSNSNFFGQVKLGNNFSTAQPMRHHEDDGNSYDSGNENASTSNFEFHRGGKISHHPVIGPFSRHIPSKWNDAEKWLVNRQAVQENGMKKSSVQNQCSRLANSSGARIAPESMITDQKPVVIHASISNSNSQNIADKFSFVSQDLHASSVPSNAASCLTDPSQGNGGLVGFVQVAEDLNYTRSSVSDSFPSETTDIPGKQLVSMRDIGTEMTPIPSHEPSRTGTPFENLTPNRSPTSSIPSSPRGKVKVDMKPCNNNEDGNQNEGKKMELSERELQLKTRQEIAALGLQLGKLNIASWAKNVAERAIDEEEELKRQYEARAVAWIEAEKSKQMARYKREELKIQEWESNQRAKYEATVRKIEIRAVNMRTRAEAAIVEKLRKTEQKVEEKRANAESKMNFQAAKTSQQAEQIRQSGRVPSQARCCIWFL